MTLHAMKNIPIHQFISGKLEEMQWKANTDRRKNGARDGNEMPTHRKGALIKKECFGALRIFRFSRIPYAIFPINHHPPNERNISNRFFPCRVLAAFAHIIISVVSVR